MVEVELKRSPSSGDRRVLTGPALSFLARLHERFEPERRRLLELRRQRQQQFDQGELPDFPRSDGEVRSGDWTVAEAPADLRDRRVEITGPTDRKMIINALNSGARVFMADFEDANSPTWENMIKGQANLVEAVRGTITHQEGEKSYRLGEETATLVVRPRGWHLDEPGLTVAGESVSGSLFDVGLYLFHNGIELLERGSGPYFYLPKLENRQEARLWNDVFEFAQDDLEIPQGSVRATVLIETITAAFEMDEILYELRDHSAGLNAGRWDYIFSIIKKFRAHQEFVLPDRGDVTMKAPFMRAYAEALVRACHRHGAHAIGGMSAFIPSRRDESINEKALPAVRDDKEREVAQGFDGAWVAHPDLVPVVEEVFDRSLGSRPDQRDRVLEVVEVTQSELLDVSVAGGEITEHGLRNNVSVGIQYLESWLRGIGAAALFDLMEDTATAEISRAQVWQWVRYGALTAEGSSIDAGRVEKVIEEELDQIEEFYGSERFGAMRFKEARELFEHVALSDEFVDFLTSPGMSYLRS